MATTTKSTKAKNKTSKAKSSAKKTAVKAKTSSAKTVTASKSTKVTKPAAKAAAIAKAPRKRVTMLSLRRMHIVSAVVYVLLAVAAGLVMTDTSFQLTIGHLARNDILSAETTVFAPAVRAVYDIQLRWVLMAVMLLSAIGPVLYATKLEKRYTQYLQQTRMQPYRWFDLGVTGALMMEAIALLSGVNDVMVLKLMGGTVFVTAMLALVAERQNNVAAKPVWSAYLTSIFSGILPWFVVASAAVGTVVWGGVRAPWYVYALYAAFAGGWILIALNERKQYQKTGAWADYLTVERNYAALGLATKVAFAAIMIAGLR